MTPIERRSKRSAGDGAVAQAAAIPFRRQGSGWEICLIRRRDSGDWGIPKGLVDPGDGQERTAIKEAWEEAGVRGRLIGESLGAYEYAKWGTSFVVAVYLMEVLEHAEVWEETGWRERAWVPPGEAGARLADHPVRPLLDHAVKLMLVGRAHDGPAAGE